jgi:hypothetical protein
MATPKTSYFKTISSKADFTKYLKRISVVLLNKEQGHLLVGVHLEF